MKKVIDRTAPVRVAQYKARMREAGFLPVSLWVHADDAERLKAYAERLRRKYKKEA